MASKLVKQIDSYDIWQNVDATGVHYTVNAENGGQTRFVACVDSITAAIRQVQIDMAGER